MLWRRPDEDGEASLSSGWSSAKKKTARAAGSANVAPAEASPAPSRDALHEAALAYLARGAATAVTLRRVLDRKVSRWARKVERLRDLELVAADRAKCAEAIAAIIARFQEVGLVDDAAFAASRARGLSRAGRSRRAISAHLAAKGVDAEVVRRALPEDAAIELEAALTFARKRRIGPFSREETVDRAAKQKALGAMARAGFGWSTCERVFGMDRADAEERLHARVLD